jgi:hypothetical protein
MFEPISPLIPARNKFHMQEIVSLIGLFAKGIILWNFPAMHRNLTSIQSTVA